MSDFNDKQGLLQTARTNLSTAQDELYTEKELLKLQLKKIMQRLTEERLPFLSDTDDDQKLLVQLQEKIFAKESIYKILAEKCETAEEAFHQVDSPIKMVRHLNDNFPILLMPVRVQTRFITVKHLATNISKEAIFDVSEITSPMPPKSVLFKQSATNLLNIPTYSHLKNNRNQTNPLYDHFIKNIFIKNKVFEKSNLLKIVPDALELWVRIYPDDIFIHAHEPHLTLDEQLAGQQFWTNWWEVHQTNSNALAEEQALDDFSSQPLFRAWAKLQNQYRHNRAAWIFKETMPQNYVGKNTDYFEEPDFTFSPSRIKSDIWTAPILSWVMPDKFVVTLIQDGKSKHFEGKKIPHPLKLSPTPEENGSLKEIKWAEDFEEAEKIGMAIKIPLLQNGYVENQTFQQLVVTGVKTSVKAINENPEDKLSGKGLLEDLLENHSYKEKGMAILPQGTATNNFERVRSGYTSDGLPVEEVFKLETGPPLFDQEDHWKTKTDGQYLVDALGIKPSIFQHSHKSDSKDIAHSKAMNKLLWSATMGYYLQQFLQPLISIEDINKTKDFFLNHVAASGLLPVLRIGKQPYGILPISNFAQWKASQGEDPYHDRLFKKVLSPLSEVWKTFAQKVKQLTDASLEFNEGQFSEDFVKILGLNASSQTFYQRPQVGNHLIESSIAAKLTTKPRKTHPVMPGPNNSNEYVAYDVKVKALEYFNRNLLKSLNDLGFNIPFETWRISVFGNILETKSPERIFNQHFATFHKKYNKDIIDKFKPSSSRRLSKIKQGEEELNYLQWLNQSSYQELINVHFNQSPNENDQPDALLYLLARQALARNYIEVAAKLMPSIQDVPGGEIRVSKQISTIDFELEHLSEFSTPRANDNFGGEVKHFLANLGKKQTQLEPQNYLYAVKKWDYLNFIKEKTSATRNKTIGEFLDDKIKEGSKEKIYLPLTDAKNALDCLQDLPTAELHRLFTEHLDLCSYRLDAWMLGLVNQRLSNIRNKAETSQGTYIGAYGYVENLDPKKSTEKSIYKVLENPEIENSPERFISSELVLPILHFQSFIDKRINIERLLPSAYIYLGNSSSGSFERSGNNPKEIISQPQTDKANQGFIHTPSQAHAVTAAILRSGFMANNPTKDHDEFAINLSSERVRKALFYIDGMRNGQELAALLGYQFERELHDNEIPFLDAYLLDFRKACPLRKEVINGDHPTETTQAFTVVHGLDLLQFYRNKNESLDDVLAEKRINLNINNITDDDINKAKEQIKNALDHLSQSMDAISDLMASESIYHIAKGDMERSSSVLKMLSNDKEISIPEITQTPKSGTPLSHLVGVQFDLKSTQKIWLGVDSPRSMLNPGLNRWLFEQLPLAGTICFNVEVNGVVEKLFLQQLRFQPIDLLAMFQEKNPLSDTSALSFFIKEIAVQLFKPPLEATIRVLYFDKMGMSNSQQTLGELLPLINNLGQIINRSIPLFPTDLQLPSRTDPLEKTSFRNLHNSDFIDAFEKILFGADKDSLNGIYNNIRDQTNVYNRLKSEGFPEQNQQRFYTRLLQLLHASIYFNQLKEDYDLPLVYSPENMEVLLAKTGRAFLHFVELEKRGRIVFEKVKAIRDKKKQWEGVVDLGKMIFGNTLPLTPKFTLNNRDEIKAAMNSPHLMEDVEEDAKVEWLQGVALVREKIQTYKRLETFRELFKVKATPDALSILQLPYQTDVENYRWLGTTFSPQIKIKGEQLSIALELPPNYKNTSMQSGMIIDFWTERIQCETSQTAFALHYNQPNTEPPQSCLLCVAPQITGGWKWEDIVGCVLTSVDLAKKRAVEPSFLEETTDDSKKKYLKGHPLRFLLPALSIPVSNTENSPTLNFDENNNHF